MKTTQESTENQTGQKPPHSMLGIVIGILITILALILCGLYLWGSMLGEEDVVPQQTRENNEPETVRNTADIEILRTVSGSDELSAIEADLLSTNLDGLESELTIIDAELRE